MIDNKNRSIINAITSVCAGGRMPPLRYMYGRLVCLLAAAALLLTCTEIPDHCGRMAPYNPDFQFCFEGKAHKLCGNGKYNPLTEGCDKSNLVGTRCLDETFVPRGTPCGGYTLSTGTAPADGGQIIRMPDKAGYAAGEQVTLSAAEPKEGYEFMGWAGASTSTSAAVTVTMDGNKPLLAMFKPISENILATTAFPENSGNITRNPPGPEYAKGTKVTVTATPNTGYTFAGWSGASTSKTSTVNITMDGGQILAAMFIPVQYTLKANAEPENGGAVFINGKALMGAETQDAGKIEALAKPADGYVFTKWSGLTMRADNPITIDITGGTPTLTAHFQPKSTQQMNTYTLLISVNPAGAGTVTGGGNYAAGTRVTATATAASGWRFAGWSGASDETESSVTITMPTGNTALIANFTPAAVANPCAGGGAGTLACCEYNPTHESCGGPPDPCAGSGAGSVACCDTDPTHESCVVIPGWQFNPDINYGSFTDSRDGKSYRTVKIGYQTWMAENLNYSGSGGNIGVCYENRPDSCAKYGRLYNWAEVMGFTSSCNSSSCTDQVQNQHQGICPAGWHVPSDAEWKTLKYVDPNAEADYWNNVAGTKLKSKSGWNDFQGKSGNGTDDYGFSALPGGYGSGSSFNNAGNNGYWWSTKEGDAGRATFWFMFNTESMNGDYNAKTGRGALRCRQDGYTLSITAGTGGTVTPSGTSQLDSGAVVTITAKANSDYTFSDWTPTAGVANPSSANTTVSMTANRTLTANFVLTPGWQFNPDINYGSFTDLRDGKSYHTVKIGSQTWMAENLNYSGSSGNTGVCYNYSPDSCAKYGRLYDWSEVMGFASSCNSSSCASQVQNSHQGVCPAGWHVPSDAEWEALFKYVDPDNFGGYGDVAATKLRSKSGDSDYYAGTDEYGFSALSGGQGNDGGYFSNAPPAMGVDGGFWWSATANDASNAAWGRSIIYLIGAQRYQNIKSCLLSVRCLQDGDTPAPTYILSLVTGIGGIVMPNGISQHNSGAVVTIMATATSGYTFTGWTPATGVTDPSSANTTVSMTGNRTVIANFALGTWGGDSVGVDIEMVPVAGGTFTMGCTAEQGGDCRSYESPAHSVTLSSFSIGKYPVTQAQWVAVMGSNPSYFKGDNLPVETISWGCVQAFILQLNLITGKNYRLPTEAEWEFAARGGNKSGGYKYAGSNIIGDVAWDSSNSSKKTQPVGIKQANELGIYDMSGNVWEWVNDWYSDYTAGAKTDPQGPLSGSNRVIRGGSWDSDAKSCRVSVRNYYFGNSTTRHRNGGFRLVLSSPE